MEVDCDRFFEELFPALHYNLLRSFLTQKDFRFNRGYAAAGFLLPRRKRNKKAERPNYNLKNYLRKHSAYQAVRPAGSTPGTLPLIPFVVFYDSHLTAHQLGISYFIFGFCKAPKNLLRTSFELNDFPFQADWIFQLPNKRSS
ncbi:hypothetical protein [Flavobacterium sp.]|uniref:hypothetical protein n=1 Tax=Flavobacterium sp. TaxID=239 RepID=UPI0039E390FF